MEFNTIMQALVKDLAEQLRPLVADMVREELAKTPSNEDLARAVHKAVENIAANIDLAELAERIGDHQFATLAEHLSDTQLVTVGENVSVSDIAGEIDLSDLAGEIDLSDLAGELDNDKLLSNVDVDKLLENIDVDKLLENVDLDEKLRDFFSNNTFAIRP